MALTLLDIKECIKYVPVTPQALRKAIKEGRLKATKYGNSWVVRWSDLLKYKLVARRRLHGR